MPEKRVVAKKNEAQVLTGRAISAAEHREHEYWMSGGGGLYLRVHPRRSGGKPAKTFYHVWTNKGSVNKNRLLLGNWIADEKSRTKPGQLTLSQATKRSREISDQLAMGGDPRTTPNKKEEEKGWNNMTVGDLIDKYLAFFANPTNKKAPYTHTVYQQILNTYVRPVWGTRMLTSIRRSDARELITTLKNTPKKHPAFAGETITGIARQVLKTCSAMFNFQIMHEDDIPSNPFHRLGLHVAVEAIMETKKTERSLKQDEIKKLWETLNRPGGRGSNAARRALLLCLVTGQRPGEVAGMHRREIDGEWWQIPKERVKTRNEHRIYLSKLARRIIGEHEDFIFPSPYHDRKGEPIHEDTLSQLVNKKIEKKDRKTGKVLEITQPEWLGLDASWTPHDLRKTVSTGLASLACSQDIIDKILNHQLAGVRGTYNLHDYDPQKIDWHTKWSAHIEMLVGGEASSIWQSEEAYDVERLRELASQYPLEKIGKTLGVTGNAVKKRCLKHGIELLDQGHWLKRENRGYVMPDDQAAAVEVPVDEGFTVRKIRRRE